MLTDDLVKFENAVNSAIKVLLSQNKFDALVAFAYNIGIHAFKNKATAVGG